MLRALVEKLLAQGRAEAEPKFAESTSGRAYLLQPGDGTWKDVGMNRSPDKTHKFGTVQSLTRYLKDDLVVPADCAVIVSPSGIMAFLDEQTVQRRDVLTVPFFEADLPEKGTMGHEDLILYLDQHAGKIEDEAAIRAALTSVKVITKKNLVLRDMGAVTKIEVNASKTATGSSVEDQPVTLPKYITITLRIGTREYEEPHKFRLRVAIVEDVPFFSLIHIDRDGAVDRFMERCIADVQKQLGEDWRVYQGA